MSKTLVLDKAGELSRMREQIAERIEGDWSKLQKRETKMAQACRRIKVDLGEEFLHLRDTYGEKDRKGFVAYCRKRFPAIGEQKRNLYISYRLKLGPVEKLDLTLPLPAVEKVVQPLSYKRKQKKQRKQFEYGRIVDEEVDPADYEGPITKREAENELVFELAEKIISAGFRVLSVKLHPDRDGGSNEAQKRLSAAKKLLEDALAREELRR